MAVIKDIEELSIDIRTAAATYWDTYRFGYLGEVNNYHNNDYPLMLLLPPRSSFDDPYKNDEEFILEFHLYKQIEEQVSETTGNLTLNQNQTVMLERTFDDLLSRFKETMEDLYQNYEHKYINAGGWEIERLSQQHADRLVSLVVTIRLRKFSFCLQTSENTDVLDDSGGEG